MLTLKQIINLKNSSKNLDQKMNFTIIMLKHFFFRFDNKSPEHHLRMLK